MILSRYLKIAPALIVGLSCLLLTGCGHSSARAPVEGSVTLDGTPVDGGRITFAPDEYKEGGIERANVTADIKNGKYSVDAANGAVPGKYRVEIVWFQKTGKQIADPDSGQMKDEEKQIIPTAYNSGTQTHVEIQASGNKFDYALSSKAVDTTKGRPPTPTRD
jgi:hypothetical protein